MVRVLSFLAPWTKYIWVFLLLASFGSGYWLTSNHYQARIETIKAENNKAHLAYTNRIIEKDNEYRTALRSIQSQLTVVQGKLRNETTKPDYLCPIPDSGVGLLNDAIRSKPGTKSSK